MEKYFGEDTALIVLAVMFMIFMAVRAWNRGAMEMLWTLLAWSGGGFTSALAFRHGPTLLTTYAGIKLDEGTTMVAGVICSVIAFAIVRGIIVWLIHRIFGPESQLGGWMYGGTGSIVSVLPSLGFLLLVALLVRGTGTMFELESIDRIAATSSAEERAKLSIPPTPTVWRNSLEGLPNTPAIMNVFDPVATPARRNLAALLLASHNETIRFQLRRSPITADLVNHPVTTELIENSPDLTALILGTGGEFKYFRLLRHPKIDQALADNDLRKSLEQIDVADEVKSDRHRAINATSQKMARKDFLVTIGLEVHVQLKTRTKMFCGCAVAFGADPNTLCCPVCLGLPGALPVLNKRAIEMTLLAGRMLGCSTPEISKWDRKNYFYPDMPKNYQISQFDLPLCLGGGVPLYELSYPKDHQKSILNPGKIIGLTRIHLEEDVAKSTHLPKSTLIDFNRAGTPLMEIVSEPEIESPEEAVAYLNSLRQILLYGEVSDADMEKGQMRCDVNVSVRPKNQEQFGTKIELKNLNSVSAVRRALHYEIDRQVQELEEGNRIVQATWRWNDDAGQTEWMRNKEDSHDYRYFPDPDLLPVRTATMLAAIEAPELPHQKQDRFIRDFGVTSYDGGVLSADRALANYFEEAASGTVFGKKIANWVINNLLSALKDADLNLLESPIRPLQIRALVQLIEDGRLTNNQAKEVFARVFSEPHHEDIAALAISMGFEPASAGEVETFVDQVIAANPGLIAEIKGGNAKAINSLLGQVMKLSGGKGDPKVIRQLLEQKNRLMFRNASIAIRLCCLSCLIATATSGFAAPADDVKAPAQKKGGISVLVHTLGSKLVIQRVIPGGPADKAGIQAMDEIVQIEQDWISGMSTPVAISHLRGDPGTPVQIFIRRQDRADLLKFIIVRQPLPEQPPQIPDP